MPIRFLLSTVFLFSLVGCSSTVTVDRREKYEIYYYNIAETTPAEQYGVVVAARPQVIWKINDNSIEGGMGGCLKSIFNMHGVKAVALSPGVYRISSSSQFAKNFHFELKVEAGHKYSIEYYVEAFINSSTWECWIRDVTTNEIVTRDHSAPHCL